MKRLNQAFWDGFWDGMTLGSVWRYFGAKTPLQECKCMAYFLGIAFAVCVVISIVAT